MDKAIRDEMYGLGGGASAGAPKTVIPGEVEETAADVVARNLRLHGRARRGCPGSGRRGEEGTREAEAASTGCARLNCEYE